MAAELSSSDVAIWRTVWINDRIDAGTFHTVEELPTSFAPHLGGGERVLAGGPFSLFAFAPGGDGTYLHKSGGGGFLISNRPGVMAAGASFMLAGAAARAVGNSRRRRQAELQAQAQWQQIDAGMVFVSQHGFYLQTPQGLHPWGWESLQAAELVGPGQTVLSGQSESGAVQWVLGSDWSELVFTLWARAHHPKHPQYLGGTWVPPGWVDRVRASGYGLPPLASGHWGHLLPPP